MATSSDFNNPLLAEMFRYVTTDNFEFARMDISDASATDRITATDGKSGGTFLDAEQQDVIQKWAATKKAVTNHPAAKQDQKELYRPIADPFEIRVLEVIAGSHDEKLKGVLHHCSVELEATFSPFGGGLSKGNIPAVQFALSMDDFTRPIWYTALSYTWGEPIFNGQIEIHGHVKAITNSLEAFLRSIRRRNGSVVVWVDQICIDQENGKEKEQQIPLMSQIYRHALNTIVWLGESSADARPVIQLLEDVNVNLHFVDWEIKPAEFERNRLPKPDEETWHALWTLLSRPWFTRLWIIQEVILSKDVWINYGNSFIRWDTLVGACVELSTCGILRWLEHKYSESSESTRRSDPGEWAITLDQMRTRHNTLESKENIMNLLVDTRSAQCYDSRDKVYGMLGMCADQDRGRIRPSYAPGFNATELYHSIAARYLEEDPSRLYRVLTSVDHESSDLPSWVPDWRRPRQTAALGYGTFSLNIYHAGGPYDWKKRPHLSINQENPNELRVKGLFFDALIQTSIILPICDLDHLNPKNDSQTLLESFKFVSQLKTYPYPDGTVFSAFWHTLVGGKDDTEKQPCPDSFAEIISLLLDASTNLSPSLPGQTYTPRQLRPQGKGRLELSNLRTRAPSQTFQQICIAAKRATENRRLGITQGGYLGLFPGQAANGDEVFLLEGCHVPFLLRRNEEEGFTLVGECYVYGIMNGELLEQGVQFKEITLV